MRKFSYIGLMKMAQSSAANDAQDESGDSVQTQLDAILTPEFFNAVSSVESNGDDTAINARENAHGRYQIRPAYLADANAAAGTNYTLDDMHDAAIAEQMMRAYFSRFGRAYSRRTGQPLTAEVLARIHNGGPSGYRRSSTTNYAARVTGALEQ